MNLRLEDPDDQLEFQLATWYAVENLQPEFEFQGMMVPTDKAIAAVNEIVSHRTYH